MKLLPKSLSKLRKSMGAKLNPTAVLLASGGLDSTVLAFSLLQKGINFIPLFVDYGQHSRRTELTTLRSVLPVPHSQKVVVVRLPKIYEGSKSRLVRAPNLWRDRVCDEDLHLPNRNLLLLASGVSFAESRGIHDLYAAFIETHRAPGSDCCNSFFKIFEKLLSATSNVRLRLPFRRMSKTQVARMGVKMNVPIDLTFSCLAAPCVPCGACPNCVDRLKAFESLH